ncbi:MAG: hypothetical protein IJ106_06500 [Parasporobacterium sp.]|nr:hypothetical protein [Parasporobacterium sp.]
MKLEIISTSVINHYNISGIASSVTGVVYKADGREETVTAQEGKVLVLVIDGVQEDLLAGKSYEVKDTFKFVPVKVYKIGGPSAAPWTNPREEDKASYYFRQALLVNEDRIDEEASVQSVIVGGTYDEKSADGITINSQGGHFNGILVDNGSRYAIRNARFYAHGDGADDLSGWAASVMADNKSEVSISDSYIETEGAVRIAVYVDNTSVADVKNTVIYTQETADTYQEYNDLVPAMIKRIPFALGMDGTIRSVNVMADGQGKFENCIVVSTSWGTLSTDSGTAYDICGTYALDVKDTFSGIGYLEVAQEGKEYTAVRELNGVKYGFTVNGSGYVTYADSGVHNRYENVEFWSPDFIQVMGSGNTGSSYSNSYLNAGHTAFMTQQSGGGTFDFTNTTIDTVDSFFQIKSGAANTGFSNVTLDNCRVNFSGTSTRSDRGILVELIESDDAGNPGILTYTINDHPEDAVATNSDINDSTATLKNGSYKGDIYNCIYNYRQALNVTLENAELEGVVSSSTAIHVDLDGKVVPNGTVLNAYMGSKEYNHANYAAEKGGFDGDCKIIGRFRHTISPLLNNPVNLTLKNSRWVAAGDGYVTILKADQLTDITAESPVTITVKALIIGDKTYEDGTYTEGNVTFVVDSTEIEVIDNGICDAGQTYGNVKYAFIARTADGAFDSKALTVKRQNYVDGNLYYKLIPAEGVKIVSCEAKDSRVEKNTAGGELAIYDYVLCPEGQTTQMSLEIVVEK